LALVPAALLKLAAALTGPALASLPSSDDPIHVKLKPVVGLTGRLRDQLRLILGQLAGLLFTDATKELSASLAGAQLLRQLITTSLAIELILGLIGRDRLRDDVPRDLGEITVGLTVVFPRFGLPPLLRT